VGRSARWKVKRLGEKLAHIRATLDLSQDQLVAALDLDQRLYRSNISGYESGDREPPLPVILAYARLARISTDDLIDDRVELKLKNLK
jgi:transcriptional regulator with XRE-family HTH domain